MVATEILRSGFTVDGQRVFLECDGKVFRIGTRWVWLAKFGSIWDACDAFEAIEMMDGNLDAIARLLKMEIARVPRHRFGCKRNTMSRITYLTDCVGKRLSGLRPVYCGSKGSVVEWRYG